MTYNKELVEAIYTALDLNHDRICSAFGLIMEDIRFKKQRKHPCMLLDLIERVKIIKHPAVAGRNSDRVWAFLNTGKSQVHSFDELDRELIK